MRVFIRYKLNLKVFIKQAGFWCFILILYVFILA